MKAILLAAGEGKRMRPLTLSAPKGMADVLGKPLMHHIINCLPDAVNEIILVIGYKGEQYQQYFGEQYEGRKIRYVWQEKPLGTGHALFLCKDLIKKGEKFLFVLADDLHSKEALTRLIKHPLGVLVRETKEPSRFGIVTPGPDGTVLDIEEKPLKPKTNLAVIGVYMFDDRIFHYKLILHERLGEYFIPDIVSQLLKDHKMVVEKTDFWHPVGYPEDVEEAERILGQGRVISNNTLVVMLAGGKGTRMPETEKHLPKLLVDIAGKPMLEHQIENAARQGFRRIRLALGYKSEMIIDWLKQKKFDFVDYVVENEPLGTGGAIKLASVGEREPFFAINADNLADWNFSSILRHSGSEKYAVLVGLELEDASDFGLVECDDFKKVCSFKEKDRNAKRGLVSAGCYILRPSDFKDTPKVFSIERDLFPKLTASGELVMHRHKGNYWFDCGNQERLKRVREYFANSKG